MEYARSRSHSLVLTKDDSMIKRALAVASLFLFASCNFIGGPVTTRMNDDAFRLTEDAGGKLFVSVDEAIRRYSTSRGALTYEKTWNLNLGWIVDVDGTERANEIWVLVRGANDPDVIRRYTLGSTAVLTAQVSPAIADQFGEIRSISAGPGDTLYMVGGRSRNTIDGGVTGEVLARCTVRGSLCTDFVYTRLRGDGQGLLAWSARIEADLETGDVYAIDFRGGVQMYTSTLAPTNLPAIAYDGATSIIAEDGFVAVADDHHITQFTRSALGLTRQGTYTVPGTQPVQNVLASGRRTSDWCGYLWDLRVNAFTNKSDLDYHRIGLDALNCP
jgi:hypothetical protein